ncbi:FAD-binding protein [Ktedonosporobacter rubrisoli]|uniref:FAD-binding protein n=1 Tax=Ktedonosporobacter rubrisoli TaxID=2509675 RepID=A0A4P6JQB8_KTERU|nr:FAD-binding protein [Ktedonosporobacter rubrisoli]QBD77474.1 FAD-binding protein [Ktedonosporobacter rubrisoli]
MDKDLVGQHDELVHAQVNAEKRRSRDSLAAQRRLLPPHTPIPAFDGTFSTLEAECQRAAYDFGHSIHNSPIAVLKPGSFEDLIRIVQFARQHQLQIAPRGQGHSMYGQAQVKDGIVVDTSSLRNICAIHSDRVEVEAGVLWQDLLRATIEHGLLPPVYPNYPGLSIGGVLSVGGFGPGSQRYGAVVDNVLELQVVTGAGKLEICSPDHQPDLFEATLAGLGQCAIIARATLRLIPAKTRVRVFQLFYPTLASLIQEAESLLHRDDERFDSMLIILAYVDANPGGMWVYMLNAIKSYTPPVDQIENDFLLRDLHYLRGRECIHDMRSIDYVRSIADWTVPHNENDTNYHSWFDVFVPTSTVTNYIHEALKSVSPLRTGFTSILTPLNASRFRRQLLRLPATETFFLIDLLRTDTTREALANSMVYNRTFFERCCALGGTRYPIGMLELSAQDWKKHYGAQWDTFMQMKNLFDPDCILTPGPGIFQQ